MLVSLHLTFFVHTFWFVTNELKTHRIVYLPQCAHVFWEFWMHNLTPVEPFHKLSTMFRDAEWNEHTWFDRRLHCHNYWKTTYLFLALVDFGLGIIIINNIGLEYTRRKFTILFRKSNQLIYEHWTLSIGIGLPSRWQRSTFITITQKSLSNHRFTEPASPM